MRTAKQRKASRDDLRDRILANGKRIGHNTACPDVVFMELDGTAWSVWGSNGACNHGDIGPFVAQCREGKLRVTLLDEVVTQLDIDSRTWEDNA